MSDGQLLWLAAALVAVAGLMAMTEAALAVVSPARAGEMAKEGERGAATLQVIASDVVRHLNLLLLLRMACELAATVMVTLVAVDAFDRAWGAALTASVMTVVFFVVVGVAPRTIGRQHAYRVGRAAAPIVQWLSRALGPLTRLLIVLGNVLTPGRGFRQGPFAWSEDEVHAFMSMVARGYLDGVATAPPAIADPHQRAG